MSTIDSLNSTSTSGSSAADVTKLGGTKDEFLKLFMAQLQHQDPLSPKSGSDMVAQLAQFSSVEQAAQTNQQLSALTASQSSTANASLSTLVGRTCSASVGDVHLTNPLNIPPITVASTSAIQGASIVVTDASGKEIRRMPVPASGTVQWDGRDSGGNLVKPGDFNVSVDRGTSTDAVTATWTDRIDSVLLDSTGARLQMGGITILPSSVTSIGALTGLTGTTTTDAITAALAAGGATTQGNTP